MVKPHKFNTLAIVGFVLAFIIPIVGLILSIIAVSDTKKKDEKGHGLAIAGIIISAAYMIFSLLIIIGSLAYLGSLDPNLLLVDSCNIQGFNCEADVAADGTVIFEATNLYEDMTSGAIMIGECQKTFDSWDVGKTKIFNCFDPENIHPGYYKSDILLSYTTEESNFPRTVFGTVRKMLE